MTNPGPDFEYVVLVNPSTGAAYAVSSGSGGTSMTDDAAFTAGSSSFTPSGGIVTADSVDSGDGGAFAMLTNRQQKVTLYDSSGVEVSVGGGTQYDEDSVHSSGDKLTMAGAVRQDTAAALAGTDGDRSVLITDGSGRLHVNVGNTVTVGSHAVTNAGTFVVQVDGTALTRLTDIETNTDSGAVVGNGAAATAQRVTLANDSTGIVALTTSTASIGKLAANSGVDIGDVDVTSVIPGTGATNLGKAEDAAHSSGDTGIMALGVRVDTPNATVAANGDYHYLATDLVGGVRTALYETDFAVLGTNHVKKYYTNAGAVTDGIIWSPAAGKRWYVTDIFIQVSAAATVTLEDDLAGGDSAVWKAELAANSGWSHSFATPLFSGEDAADLIVTTSAGNVYITVTGYEV